MSAEDSPLVKSATGIWSARLTAIGFVVLILGGNAWLVFGLVGGAIPDWLKMSAAFGVGLVGCGGLGFGIDFLIRFRDRIKQLK